MPRSGQLVADPGRVGVDDLAEQQLGADGDDLTLHAASAPIRAVGCRGGGDRLPVDRYWPPVTTVRPTATHSTADADRRWLGGQRGEGEADSDVLDDGLDLGQAGRHGDAPPAQEER